MRITAAEMPGKVQFVWYCCKHSGNHPTHTKSNCALLRAIEKFAIATLSLYGNVVHFVIVAQSDNNIPSSLLLLSIFQGTINVTFAQKGGQKTFSINNAADATYRIKGDIYIEIEYRKRDTL